MRTPRTQARRPRRGRLDRLRFLLEHFLLGGLSNRLLLAAGVVTTTALVAGVVLALLEPDQDLGEAVWWAFLRLTDPGYLGDDQGLGRRTVSTVVTVLGYLLFLGLLIAILSQWLAELIAGLEAGTTPVALSGHIVLLGWSHRTPVIVSELLRTRKRVQRFLARHGERRLRIVVLAEEVDRSRVRALRQRIGGGRSAPHVWVRSGVPLHLEHLERVAFRDAAVLILLGADHAAREAQRADAETVKTLRAVSAHARDEPGRLPLVVTELIDGRNAETTRRAYAGESEVVAADEMVSHLVAQSLLQRGLCRVFTELLTLDEGNAIYLREYEGAEPAEPEAIRSRLSRAVLLGFLPAAGGAGGGLRLNPGPGEVIAPGDGLVLLARDYEDCAPGAARGEAPPRSAPGLRPAREERRRRLLILGWSRKVPTLLSELATYGCGTYEVHVVSATPVSERLRSLEAHGLESPPVDLHHVEKSYLLAGVLEAMDPAGFDHVLLLASEWAADEALADANTVFAHQRLLGLLPGGGTGPQIVVELMEEENLFLFDPDREDVIVSPTIVGYLVSQVALRRELAAVFDELVRPFGEQVGLHDAIAWVGSRGPLRFGELERVAAARGEVALGVMLAGEGLLLNPDRDRALALQPGDEVVVLASHERPPAAPPRA